MCLCSGHASSSVSICGLYVSQYKSFRQFQCNSRDPNTLTKMCIWVLIFGNSALTNVESNEKQVIKKCKYEKSFIITALNVQLKWQNEIGVQKIVEKMGISLSLATNYPTLVYSLIIFVFNQNVWVNLMAHIIHSARPVHSNYSHFHFHFHYYYRVLRLVREFILAIPRSSGHPFHTQLLLLHCQTLRLIIYSAFDFANGTVPLRIISHSLSVMNAFQTWHIKPSENTTAAMTTAPTSAATNKTKKMFSAFSAHFVAIDGDPKI